MRRLVAAVLVLGLAACASQPTKPDAGAKAPPASPATGSTTSPYPPAQEDPSKRGDYTAGGLYAPHIKDSAPGEDIDVSAIPEPAVVAEPRSRYGNRSTYSVLGKNYHVMDDAAGYVEQGLASYYGKKFHGRRTSNMEVYDMYAFTAAHKTLPLPSFARVTNLDNNRSVVVRVNDRGPFHKGRIIDLSYAAAVKLGITRAGTGRVEVRALLPGEAQSLRADAAPVPAPVDTRTADIAPRTTMDTLVAALPDRPASLPADAAAPMGAPPLAAGLVASTDLDAATAARAGSTAPASMAPASRTVPPTAGRCGACGWVRLPAKRWRRCRPASPGWAWVPRSWSRTDRAPPDVFPDSQTPACAGPGVVER